MTKQEPKLLPLDFKLTDGQEVLYTHNKFEITVDLSVKNKYGKISYPKN